MANIVLYPSSGIGHLISMVELGKFILRHHPSSAVTILTATPSLEAVAAYIHHVSATEPSIKFHHLPHISTNYDAHPSAEAAAFDVFRRRKPDIRRALETITSSGAVSAFITDFFCTPSLPDVAEFNIPIYYFITSGAAFVAFLLYFPTLDKTTTRSFKDMKNTLLDVPGIPPLPATDVLRPILDRTAEVYGDFLDVSANLRNADGVLVNTFEGLEIETLNSMREGKCNSDGPSPPVFCVGPLLAKNDGGGGAAVLKWLDGQPSKSVVYLCFGSMGVLSAAQLKETAEGLERSGHPFLWVFRLPPSEPDLEAVLPTGFLDRTKDRGLVVTPWAPQVAVLNHESVGGFVTHCGWNSILEAVWAGVPMVAWPLYAEQHMNRVVVVEGMRVALRMVEAEGGFVAAEQVEQRVRELMSDKGKEIRRVVEERRLEARAAMAEGGSSVATTGKLVELWKSG